VLLPTTLGAGHRSLTATGSGTLKLIFVNDGCNDFSLQVRTRIDSLDSALNNCFMATELKTTGIPVDVLADGEAVIESIMTGKKLDPEIARRVRERAAEITERIHREHGVLDIGTPAIRELRDS
jgi:hypothetical protein